MCSPLKSSNTFYHAHGCSYQEYLKCTLQLKWEKLGTVKVWFSTFLSPPQEALLWEMVHSFLANKGIHCLLQCKGLGTGLHRKALFFPEMIHPFNNHDIWQITPFAMKMNHKSRRTRQCLKSKKTNKQKNHLFLPLSLKCK